MIRRHSSSSNVNTHACWCHHSLHTKTRLLACLTSLQRQHQITARNLSPMYSWLRLPRSYRGRKAKRLPSKPPQLVHAQLHQSLAEPDHWTRSILLELVASSDRFLDRFRTMGSCDFRSWSLCCKMGSSSGFICALKTAAVSNCPNFSSFLSQVRSFRQPVYKLGAFDSLYRSVIEIAPYLCSPVFGVEICVIFQQSRFKRKSPISRKAFPCISNSLQNGQEFLSVTS